MLRNGNITVSFLVLYFFILYFYTLFLYSIFICQKSMEIRPGISVINCSDLTRQKGKKIKDKKRQKKMLFSKLDMIVVRRTSVGVLWVIGV